MQNLIAAYFLENKQCFIPSLGLLSLRKTPASYNFSEQSISAPIPTISFEKKEIENHSLAEYISVKRNITKADADNMIADFSASVNFLAENESKEIVGLGEFKKMANGKLEFIAKEVNPIFYTATQAVKVMHPNASHNMTVGDTETNTATMTEYYADDVVVTKEKWWLPAAIFSVLSVAALCYYIFGLPHNNVANIMPIEKISADTTFTVPK
jgi:hypothetical protein